MLPGKSRQSINLITVLLRNLHLRGECVCLNSCIFKVTSLQTGMNFE